MHGGTWVGTLSGAFVGAQAVAAINCGPTIKTPVIAAVTCELATVIVGFRC